MTDYTIPCHKSSVHPDGICRKKLHKNIGGGFHRLMERMEREAMEAELENHRQQIEEQKKRLDMDFKMAQVAAGTHRIMKDTRKNKPKPMGVTSLIQGNDPSKKQTKKQ